MTAITVKLFGPQARLAQQREVVVECDADPATADAVLCALSSACPALAEHMDNSKLAVNHELVSAGDPVRAGDEVALIGMLGGG